MEEDAPGLILLDIQMPEVSGMEALMALKSHHPEIPVMMVSASTARSVAQESVEKGAAGFLLKPFEPEELRRKVEEVLGQGKR